MKPGLLGLALLLAIANPVFAEKQKKNKGKEESSLSNEKIKILRMNPPAFTTEMNTNFFLQVRIEPEDQNRFLVIILESGIKRHVSSKSLDGANERPQQMPLEQFLVAGNYKVIIATCDGRSKSDKPGDLGSVVHKIERTLVVGGSAPAPSETGEESGFADSTNTAIQLPSPVSNASEQDGKVQAEDVGNPCFLQE